MLFFLESCILNTIVLHFKSNLKSEVRRKLNLFYLPVHFGNRRSGSLQCIISLCVCCECTKLFGRCSCLCFPCMHKVCIQCISYTHIAKIVRVIWQHVISNAPHVLTGHKKGKTPVKQGHRKAVEIKPD